MIKHWVSQLPEFNATLTILQLLDEKKECEKTIADCLQTSKKIDEEILSIVKTQWTQLEIVTAQAKDFELKTEGE